MEIWYPKYFRVKCYNDSSVHLWIISVCVKKYQQTFLAPLLGNGCCIISESNSPMYPCVLPFTKSISFIFFIMKPFSSKSLCSSGWVLRATTIEANHSFWLWTPSWLYSHGSGTNLLRLSLQKLLPSAMGISSTSVRAWQSQTSHKKTFGRSCFPSFERAKQPPPTT